MSNDLYIYLFDRTSGGGHKVRAEKWQLKTKGEICNIARSSERELKKYDTLYVDVKKCPESTARLLADACSNLIFIDDFGSGAMRYARKIIVNIPYYDIPQDPRIVKNYITSDKVKKINCYLYCGYSDPFELMIKYIEDISLHYPVDIIYCVLGEGFTFEYLQKIKYMDAKIVEVALGDVSDCQLAFCTWGLHYLEICQKIPTIPITWDDHTQRLVHYFLGECE